MHKPGLNFHLPLFALFALIAALAIPATALAENPVVDQYAPTVPTPDGPEAPPEPEPDTNSGAGGFDGGAGGSSGGTDAAGGSSGSGGSSSTAPETAPTGADTATAAPVDPASSATDSGGNSDKDTLEGLAAGAEQERQDASGSRTDEPATDLLSSGSGADTATVVFLWAVLGVTALWAIATIIRRRRDGDGHPA